ncbi:MAG: fumarylacetoacetase [Blastocatellia bacterium]
MSVEIHHTNHPRLRSHVREANERGADFPIQNLPYGVFRDAAGGPRIGVAIGDSILDMPACVHAGMLDRTDVAIREALLQPNLNALMALPTFPRMILRERISALLVTDNQDWQKVRPLLVSLAEAEMLLPARVGDYTDFYASIYHAENVGRMMRPDNPLLPNYKYVPIGYHGRASSLVVSGAQVRRPHGQIKPPEAAAPVYGPCRMLDYEVEAGFFIAGENAMGDTVEITRAEDRLFGLCLVNDWSARDIQAWEYQPLGPFLAKSFATTISPWVVTAEALAPFRVPAFARPPGDPAPLPYLDSLENRERGGIDLRIELLLCTAEMRRLNLAPAPLSQHRLRDLYWAPAQMITHHAGNGCNLQPGDLLASGTISGPEPDMRGSLLELTMRGAQPLTLPNGETRRFLEDGDEIIMRGWCEREGFARIGFGKCRGIVTPAG